MAHLYIRGSGAPPAKKRGLKGLHRQAMREHAWKPPAKEELSLGAVINPPHWRSPDPRLLGLVLGKALHLGRLVFGCLHH